MITPQWSAGRVATELDLPNVLGVKVYYSLISEDSTTRDKYLEAISSGNARRLIESIHE